MSTGHNQIHTPSNLIYPGKRGIFQIIFGRTMVILLLLILQFFLIFARLYDLFKDIPLLFGSVELFTAVMLLWILNTRENPTIKLTWAIVIAVLPVFGTLLYWFLRLDIGHRVVQKRISASIAASQSYIPDQSNLEQQLQKSDKNLANLVHYLKQSGNFSIYSNTKVTYFPLGDEMFQKLLIQLENAKKFIFLEYFTVAPGYMWDKILEVLQRKASEGVEVRFMYDGMATLTNMPYRYPRELENLGICCKVFSPVRPFVSTHYNNRDHRKITVIDGIVAFTGGINLEDRYINKEAVYGHWKDTAVMVQGDAAQGFTRMFLQMWNYDAREPLYEPYLAPPAAAFSADGFVLPYGDSPIDRENIGKMVYLHILNQARDYVYIMTPYLILDNEMITALTFAAKRGVDVRLILPHIPDKQYAFILAHSHYPELLEAGVKIYEYTPGFVHGKVFLSDDLHAVVGTINLDYRSLYLHFECAAYLYKVPALADIKEDFRRTMAVSQEVSTDDVKNLPLFSRLAGKLLKLAAPLM